MIKSVVLIVIAIAVATHPLIGAQPDLESQAVAIAKWTAAKRADRILVPWTFEGKLAASMARSRNDVEGVILADSPDRPGARGLSRWPNSVSIYKILEYRNEKLTVLLRLSKSKDEELLKLLAANRFPDVKGYSGHGVSCADVYVERENPEQKAERRRRINKALESLGMKPGVSELPPSALLPRWLEQ